MTSRPTLVALDQGTSVTRAGVYRDGRLVAEARRPLGLHFPGAGRAEQDAAEILEAATSALAEACDVLGPGERAVLGIASQRSTVVLWDAESGRALGPALSWRDSRATAESDAMAASVKDLQHRTGLPATPHYGAPKIAWALRHWPQAADAARGGRLRAGCVATWTAWNLSQSSCFAIDPTNAQRMLLMGLGTLDWDAELLRASGVPAACLPQVRPTDGSFGDARFGRHVIPMRAMLGDQQAALQGVGELLEGRALVQLGTGGFVLRGTGGAPVFAPGLLAGIARADTNRPRLHLIEGPVSSAGSAFDRLRDLGILREGEDVDDVAGSAVRPVVVVPAWAGLAAPWWSPTARAAIMGWDEGTTRADIVAGTVHGIAFLVSDILDFMTSAGVRVTELALSGSLSQVRCVTQAIADASGLEAIVRLNPEATLEGVATVLAEATDGVPPALSLTHGERVLPRRRLSAERTAFAAARRAASALSRLPEAEA